MTARDLGAIRAQLAQDQAQFVAIMVGGADNTMGLDQKKLDAARSSLFSKRLSTLGGHYRGLAVGLKRARSQGEPAWETAQEWHTTHPPADHDTDGASLLFCLAEANQLPPEARADFVGARIRYRRVKDTAGTRAGNRAGDTGCTGADRTPSTRAKGLPDVKPRVGPFVVSEDGLLAFGWGRWAWIFRRGMR
ncbi:hypothetical protein HMPREF0183_1920 [Brevibacterium mcbrellneri ATCC 49030]|uniref:Uncharacterized protein n=1 Tax=Brevibacterium mcbrellneri ATCC 49030 TaxID=585530 RepID=D4YPR0_9MICO|nr:hypothetical protein [Brevibacterium mcbrellneri]EFG46795.1 hypothetical protein HMPREF0183_1920 [Brevibacterium mcbrellneri ATCC 49030]